MVVRSMTGSICRAMASWLRALVEFDKSRNTESLAVVFLRLIISYCNNVAIIKNSSNFGKPNTTKQQYGTNKNL